MRRSVLACLLVACGGEKEPTGPAKPVVKSLTTTDGENVQLELTVTRRGRPVAEAGMLRVEFSQPRGSKQHCMMELQLTPESFGPDKAARLSGKLKPRCQPPSDGLMDSRILFLPKNVDGGFEEATDVIIPPVFGGSGAPVATSTLVGRALAMNEAELRAKPPAPTTDPKADELVATIAALVDKVPSSPPPAPTKCAPDVLGTYFHIDHELATRVKDGRRLPNTSLLDEYMKYGGADYDVVRYAAHDKLPPDALAALAKIQPTRIAFQRFYDVQMPSLMSEYSNGFTGGHLRGAIFVIDKTTKEIVCQAGFEASSSKTVEATAKTRESKTSHDAFREDFVKNVSTAIMQARVALGEKMPETGWEQLGVEVPK